ncbi:TPA: phospholipase D family protein [Klebsiella variicola subsp. variicola]|uniref:phospholipase D family nuclease n=1 Tax=Klebsiella TaxID=570 RepID=UPI00044816E7|nr:MULTISPECIES: phospholipase D family protein [Klebsiella]HCB0739795.1 phospholipase D family protein [Klebsiella variicola subsp. variicola]ELT5805959.1 phospholipase D family protein [Klebsiella variicola]EWD70436.1 endonuclease [Klebsiella variicola]MCJ6564073.1 phospholipase D family protein [Klebsiella variicola]MDS6629753.1 phospholipase D family protein [Klebsiella variicola]
MSIEKRTTRQIPASRWWLPGLLSLVLYTPVPAVNAASIETGFSPEGTALQLVLKTIDSAQQEIRLMGYSFTSPEVTRSLIAAKRRGVDIRVVLDQKANTGKASVAAMNVLVSAGIPVRTVDVYKILHDKVIVADKRNTEVGSFNFSRAADRSNSENVLVVWDDPVVARSYLNHWASRWAQGTDWKSTY